MPFGRMPRFALAVVAPALVALAAAAIGPASAAEPPPSASGSEPPPDAPTSPPSATPPSASPPAPGAAATLTFAEALSRLQTANPDLAVARARALEARADARLALADLLPSLSISGGWTRNDAEVVATGPSHDVTLQPLSAWEVSGDVRVPILDASAWASRGAARAQIRAADADAEATRLDAQVALVEACVYANVAEGIADAARRAQDVATARRDELLRSHTADDREVLAIEADVLRRREDVARADADAARVRIKLGAMLGLAAPVRVSLPTDTTAEAAGTPPELAAANARTAAAFADLAAARLQYVPDIAATFGAVAATAPLPNGDETAWRAGIGVSWPLFDGGAREARIAGAAARLQEATAAQDAARQALDARVATATSDLAAAKERLDLARRELEVLRRAADATRIELAAGRIPGFEARDAAERAYAADVHVQQMQGEVALAAIALRRAQGQGW